MVTGKYFKSKKPKKQAKNGRLWHNTRIFFCIFFYTGLFVYATWRLLIVQKVKVGVDCTSTTQGGRGKGLVWRYHTMVTKEVEREERGLNLS